MYTPLRENWTFLIFQKSIMRALSEIQAHFKNQKAEIWCTFFDPGIDKKSLNNEDQPQFDQQIRNSH